MDTLIPAALILIVTNLVFAYLANHWRTQAKRLGADNLRMALLLSRARQEGWQAGWDRSKQHTIGLMYKVACKADREGRDVLVALREVDKQSETESVVQVPIEV